MLTVSKSILKAHMLEYLRQVENYGEEIIITSHRKPVLKISRLSDKKTVSELFSDIRGKVNLSEKDIMVPETDEWGGLA